MWCSRCKWLIGAVFRYCDLGTYASGTEVLKLILKIHVIEIFAWIIYISTLVTVNLIKRSDMLDYSQDIFWHRTSLVSTLFIILCLQIYTLWKGIKLRSRKYLRFHIFIKIIAPIPLYSIGQCLSPVSGSSYLQALKIMSFTLLAFRWSFHVYGTIMVWKYHQKLDSTLMGQLNDYCATLRHKRLSKKMSNYDINNYDHDITISDAAVTIVPDPPVDYKTFRKHIISPWDVAIDPSCLLGEGQFGKVFKGVLVVNKSKITIAAKVAKNPQIIGAGSFQMLLHEMKIMIHVGDHENIIKFFGVTSDASVKEHFAVITGFCTNGCLDEFLKKNRQTFIDLGQSSNIDQTCTYVNLDEHGSHSTLDLIRFATEIANGMKYLGSKGVVHGDLACRNVLLTGSLRTQLTDFGMARRLYNYQIYATGGQQSLMPWRWMAIEVLEDLKFSEKSDVWAYGVTVWEIFTLGAFPFEEINWSPKIPFHIRNELRLEKPRYASDQIFEVMKKCWDISSDLRPRFSELSTTFEEIMKMQTPLNKAKASSEIIRI